jgi:hypothetical protein
MTPDDIREQLELAIVELIKVSLEKGAMAEERAQQISQAVLDTLTPGMTFEELYRAIPKLDDHCPELSPVILPILRDYETNVNQQAMHAVTDLIRQGSYDAAAKLGKQTVSQEIKLVWQGSGKATSDVAKAGLQ